MKKLRTILITTFLLFNFILTADATSISSGYNDPVIMDMNFSATLNSDGNVEMTWDKYVPSGFNYYKVIRSQTNSNPVYPDDGYIIYSSDQNFTSYTDISVPDGTVYYRVCSIASPNRYCSEVVTIDTNEEDVQIDTEEIEIVLSVKEENGKIKLSWSTDGDIENGFKIAKSTINKNPTYPVMPGDSYYYLTDSSARSYIDSEVSIGKTYYYRVCQYNGNGECLVYSNNVSITLDGSDTEVLTESEDESDLNDEDKFIDTSGSSFETAIEYVKEKSIVDGYSDNTYRPLNEINRAEFVKIIIEAKFSTEEIESCISENIDSDWTYVFFPDVAKDEWFAKYICLATQKNIISGYSDGTFRPSNTINFAEVAKIIVSTFGVETNKAGEDWYEIYVYALQDKNFIPQTVQDVDSNLNRGEMAEIIWRIKENKTDQSSSELLLEPIVFDSGEYTGWQQFDGNGYVFNYPASWYHGIKRGWDYFSEEKDYIDNLLTPYYMDVDTYAVAYIDTASLSVSDEQALRVDTWFDHPEIEAQFLDINGLPALRRKFRAPSGTVVNGRTTGENEIIIQYTYRNGENIYVLQYFNASGNEDYGIDNFDKIAGSLRVE